MSVQEAHAGALAGVLSARPGGPDGLPGTADAVATATFHPADPAIRLAGAFDLGAAGGRPLSGAHVRIDTVLDGDSELLLYDLGGSRILPSIDYLPTYGVLDIHFVGLAGADAYGRLLSSLRYINRAPHPTPGERSIEIAVLDADGAAIPVGRLALTVAPDRPALTTQSIAGEPDDAAPPPDIAAGDTGGPNPFALVVWNAADGVLGNTPIVGWHRAGDDPRHPPASRAPAALAGDRPPADMDDMDDMPLFGDEALHMFGAADLPVSWDGRGAAALAGPEGAARPSPPQPVIDYRSDGADDAAQTLAGRGYRVFAAGADDPSAPAVPGTAEIAAEPAAVPVLPTTQYVAAPPMQGAPPVFHVLRPADLFDADRTSGPGTLAAAPEAGPPRLDAFLVGLPPSGDPLLPAEGDAPA